MLNALALFLIEQPMISILRSGCVLAAFLLIHASAHSVGVEKVSVNAREISVELSGEASALVEFAPYGQPIATNAVQSGAANPNSPARPIVLARFEAERDRLYSSFAAAARVGDGLKIIGTNRYAERLENISRYVQPFPTAASKKGLQVQMLDDALKLGVKHAALNVNLTQLVDPNGATNSIPWTVDGRVIHFRRPAIAGLDRQVKTLTDAGVIVTFIVLTYASGNPALDAVMLHPRYDRTAPNHLGAFNSETPDGVRHLRGFFEFLADRYSNPAEYGGRAPNYILGNEVNSHWFWSNMGRVSMPTFAESYLRAARIAATALRKASSSARLYLSLEHHWSVKYAGGDAQQAFPGRQFLEYFNRRALEQGNFEWHLAFHPYPENLFEPRTWRDKSATTNANTPRITFRNLQMLGKFFQRPELRWNGEARHVILSEQGFHTVDGPNGELWQASAYAYAYYKAAHDSAIDAFILHRHVDHGQEGGLKLGLWSRDESAKSPATPKAQKKIYEVFRLADTPEWRSAFEFALPVIGIAGWEELESRN